MPIQRKNTQAKALDLVFDCDSFLRMDWSKMKFGTTSLANLMIFINSLENLLQRTKYAHRPPWDICDARRGIPNHQVRAMVKF